jgi:hypothetical protein
MTERQKNRKTEKQKVRKIERKQQKDRERKTEREIQREKVSVRNFCQSKFSFYLSNIWNTER